ncbi:MAG: hypothetical protein QXI43_00020 [Candidatus Nitrosocaldus sp.]
MKQVIRRRYRSGNDEKEVLVDTVNNIAYIVDWRNMRITKLVQEEKENG